MIERIGDATDKCDCCGREMKYRRIGPTYLYACQDCRGKAIKELGRSVSAIAIGYARDK